MCGIFGFAGETAGAKILLDGLFRLEYRGYDSAGIATVSKEGATLLKRAGRVNALEKALGGKKIFATAGIGHTRWATHGAPTEANAHPHKSSDGNFFVVHNGIIENYLSLKEELIADGVTFKSDTDTEVIPNLVAKYYKGDFPEAVRQAAGRLEGSFAIAVLCRHHPETLVATKRFSPLIVGKAQKRCFVSSDLAALLPHTKEIIYPEDNELVVITKTGERFFSPEGAPVLKQTESPALSPTDADKGAFPDFMLKEIYDQPSVFKNLLDCYLQNDEVAFTGLDPADFDKISRIQLVACGSAYHAGLFGEYIFESLLKIPARCETASEFRHRRPVLDGSTLTIFLSQSGETADTLAALKLAKSLGAPTLGIINTENSAIAKAVDYLIYAKAGLEIAVATTKGYTSQLVCLLLFAVFLANRRSAEKQELQSIIASLNKLPFSAEDFLKNTAPIKNLAATLQSREAPLFIGRGVDFAAALEASLKLKEIAYLRSEAYPAGELKHGRISLIESGTPVFALGGAGAEGLVSGIKEIKARGGFVILCGGASAAAEPCDLHLPLPDLHPLVSSVLEALPLQLFAYHTAKLSGCDVDKPRNLAKSVTVE